MNLTGTIVSIGLHDRDGEAIHGVLVEIPREQLQQGGILYREVIITGLPATESTTEIAKLKEQVKRLVKLGNTMAKHYETVAVDSDDDKRIEDWREAAEDIQ